MFDVGASELAIIAIVGLIVLGPDRLPGALRTAGLWIGRLRRSLSEVRAEIEREAKLDDIKREWHTLGANDGFRGVADEIDALRQLDQGAAGREVSAPSVPLAKTADNS